MATGESATNDALKDAKAAASMSNGVQQKAIDTLDRIKKLYYEENGAEYAADIVKTELGPKLKNSTEKVDHVTERNKEIKQNLEEINKQLEKLGDLRQDIEQTIENARNSRKDGTDAL